MTVKKALIISTLAVILTGITACAVSYTKKTGKSPFKALQTKADYTVNSITENNNYYNFTITEDYSKPNQPTSLKGTSVFTIDNTTTQTQVTIATTLNGIKYNNTSYSFSDTQITYTTNSTIPSGNVNISQIECSKIYFILPANRTDINIQIEYKVKYNVATQFAIYKSNTTVTTATAPQERIEVNYKVPTIYTNYQTLQNFQQIEYQNGYNEGETNGYQEGWNDNTSFNAPIDIRGLMLNVLTMPFTFIRQAFNVTMWEGTPYAFNVSNFILSLIAIATILFIIRLFTTGFSAIGNYTGNKDNKELTRAKIENTKAQTRRTNKLADKGK